MLFCLLWDNNGSVCFSKKKDAINFLKRWKNQKCSSPSEKIIGVESPTREKPESGVLLKKINFLEDCATSQKKFAKYTKTVIFDTVYY